MNTTTNNICVAVICNNDSKIAWMPKAIDFLKSSFDYAGIKSEFVSTLTHQTIGVHPSWYKLMIHRHLEWKYDYCLCWDVDLLPTNKHSVSDIINEIDKEKFYGCIDTGVLFSNHKSDFIEIQGIVSKFRWNCGLLGIPKSQALALETIYHLNNHSQKPSYEQYHVADYLYENRGMVVDGNPSNNVLVQAVATSNINHILQFALANCLHYSISDASIRSNMIQEHCLSKERIFHDTF